DSGVKNIKYSVDSGSFQTASGNAVDVSVPRSEERRVGNERSISYWATDNATNEETPHNSATVKIDTGNPSSSDNADANWHNSAVTVHMAAPDSLAGPSLTDSGVKNIKYSVDSGSFQTASGNAVDVSVP